MPYVNWVNLMSYDLHGSWDTEESYVGNYLYSHTNLTEIQDALELLWRNNVPASQVNLGIGFYGRSFKLEDSKCNTPGCKQQGGADAGPCTGQSGVLSYAEVQSLIAIFNLNVIYDEVAGVKYLSWNGQLEPKKYVRTPVTNNCNPQITSGLPMTTGRPCSRRLNLPMKMA